jgi:glycosyltransferase involved in cell wall biosynthesis
MIVFDLQPAQSLGSGNRGIGRYTRDLATALAMRHPGVVDAFCWNPNLPTDPRIYEIVPSELVVPITSLAGRPIDVFHITSPFEHVPIEELLPQAPTASLVATCFDLIPYRFQSQYLIPLARSEYLARLSLLATCDAVLTDSASAADDCAELFGVDRRRLTVIGGGTNPCFRLPDRPLDEVRRMLAETLPEIRQGFVLVPTGMDWRKNIDGAIEAYASLPAELQHRHQLVINCKVTHHERRLLERTVEAAGCQGDVVITGFVSDDDLVRLYQTTELVLFPSKYEGFGLPVLEARRCGARVICSNVSSLPEVMPLEEATFNPWSTPDIAATLQRALTDDSFAALLDTAPDPGFDFYQAADATVDAYRRVIAERRRRRSRRRPRVAVVTLLPPMPSGVADHSVALLDAMHELAEVTCFVSDDVPPPGYPTRPYPVRRLALLPALVAGGAFDRVVYTMGNNQLHRPFLELMRQVPGDVLFHDVRLGACYDPVERHEIGRRFYPRVEGTPLYAAEVVAHARTSLVQSDHAGRLLAADTGVTPVNIGPHPMRVVDLRGSSGLPDRPERVEIVTMGIADVVKQTDKFVRAADELLARHSDWSATIVGLGGPRFVGPGSRIVTTGRIDDLEFERWLERATVLVQLRQASNGESSGVTAHALAHGIPTVVTDIGAAHELPDEVVVKVPPGIAHADLAKVIEALVEDPERRQAITAAARRFAAANTYCHQAERLLAAIGVTGGV